MCNISSKCWNKLFSHFRKCKFEGFFLLLPNIHIWMDEWVCCTVFYPRLNICTIYTMLHILPDWGICDPSIQPSIVRSFVRYTEKRRNIVNLNNILNPWMADVCKWMGRLGCVANVPGGWMRTYNGWNIHYMWTWFELYVGLCTITLQLYEMKT